MLLRLSALMTACLLLAFGAAAEKVRVEFTGDYLSEELTEAVREILPDEDKPETVLQARRQGRRAATAVRKELNSLGHYDPRIDMGVEGSEPPAARLRVDPGPRFALADVSVTFTGDQPREAEQAEIRDGLPVQPGQPALPEKVIDAGRWISNTMQDAAYPYAEVTDRRVLGDREAETISVTYVVDSGPRVRFGKTIFPDKNLATKERYLNRLIPYEEGDLYDPAELALLNSRLAETRLFRVARATLQDEPAGVAEDGAEIHNVELRLTERPRNTIALGASYSTSEGTGLTAEYTRRNLTGRGDLLTTDFTLAELEQSIDVIWRRPNEFGFGRGLVFTAGIIQEQTDAYDRQALTLGAGYEVIESPQFAYSYGINGEIAKEEDEFGERDLQILSLYAGARLDHTDSVLDPRSGWRADARVEPSYTFGDQTNPFVRTSTQATAYLPVDDAQRFVLAGRLRLGAVLGADAAELPVDTRFYAGGGGSVRGYAYQAIGPRAADGTPLGGKSVVEASFETRYRWRPRIGFVAFIDAGSVSTDEFSNFDDAKYGAGIGVRYTTPAGPIRFDIATPLNPSDFDEPVQVYISIGQAF